MPIRSQPWEAFASLAMKGGPQLPPRWEIPPPTAAARPACPRHTGAGPLSTPSLT